MRQHKDITVGGNMSQKAKEDHLFRMAQQKAQDQMKAEDDATMQKNLKQKQLAQESISTMQQQK